MNIDSHQPLADDEILATLMEDQSSSKHHDDEQDLIRKDKLEKKNACAEEDFQCLETGFQVGGAIIKL